MTLSITGKLLIIEAKEYNKKVYEAKGKWGGCISTLACQNCGSLVSDSICLCMGIFICPQCNYNNGEGFRMKYDFVREGWETTSLKTNQDKLFQRLEVLAKEELLKAIQEKGNDTF